MEWKSKSITDLCQTKVKMCQTKVKMSPDPCCTSEWKWLNQKRERERNILLSLITLSNLVQTIILATILR